MILITDSHINSRSAERFFRMLERLEKNNEDIVFLGDIFDLWIALPGYEHPYHRRFLEWCAKQKSRRSIGLIEGNHEFFVAQGRKEYFSWTADSPFRKTDRGLVFCHGDRVNQKDKNYLRFRKLTRNSIIRTLMRLIPIGPAITEHIRRGLKKRNSEFREYFPEDEIVRFGDFLFGKGARNIFMGHFHHRGDYSYSPARDRKLYVLPDWQSSGIISFYDESTGNLRYCSFPSEKDCC